MSGSRHGPYCTAFGDPSGTTDCPDCKKERTMTDLDQHDPALSTCTACNGNRCAYAPTPCPICRVEPGGRHDGQAHDDHTLAAAMRAEAIKDGPRSAEPSCPKCGETPMFRSQVPRGGYPSGEASDPIPKPPTSAGPGRPSYQERQQAAVRARCTCADGFPDHAQHDPDCSLWNSGWLR